MTCLELILLVVVRIETFLELLALSLTLLQVFDRASRLACELAHQLDVEVLQVPLLLGVGSVAPRALLLEFLILQREMSFKDLSLLLFRSRFLHNEGHLCFRVCAVDIEVRVGLIVPFRSVKLPIILML